MTAPIRSRVTAGVREGGQYATEAKAESGVTLASAPEVPQALAAALDRYGLTLSDIPTDHEGMTLLDRWNEASELAAADTIPATHTVLWAELGDVDTGRHRGGPDPVWWDERASWDPDCELSAANDPDDPRWDDPDATLAAHIHTRNGGGNRECYDCPDGNHEPGCTQGANEAMQAHPAFLVDHDDTGDHTYADFYFRISGKEEVRTAVRNAPAAAVQERAARTLGRVAAGQVDPWMLFPQNPDTVEAAATARADLEALGTMDMPRQHAVALEVPVTSSGGTWGMPRVEHVRVSPEHLADFDALLEWAKDPAGDPPADTATWDRRPSTRNDLRSRGERYLERRTLARQATAATEALEAGNLPEDVAVVLRAGLENADLGKFRRAGKALAEAKEQLDATVAHAAKHRDALVAGVAKGQERARLRSLTNPPDRVLRWPGTPDTVPAALEPDTPSTDIRF